MKSFKNYFLIHYILTQHLDQHFVKHFLFSVFFNLKTRFQLILSYGIISVFSLLIMNACARPESPKLQASPEPIQQAPEPTYPKVEQPPMPSSPPQAPPAPQKIVNEITQRITETKNFEKDLIPMELVFVIDTSESMCGDRNILIKNLQEFIFSFIKDRSRIDYRIGVISVWDSLYQEYFSYTDSEGKQIEGHRKYKNGQLREFHLSDSALEVTERFRQASSHSQESQLKFISREWMMVHNGDHRKGLTELLGKSLYLPVERLVYISDPPSSSVQKKGDRIKNLALTGPENEEILSPIDSLLFQTDKEDLNGHFIRSDSHLGIFIITDADDSTNLGDNDYPRSLANRIKEMYNKRKLTVTAMGALARYDQLVRKVDGIDHKYENAPGAMTAACNTTYEQIASGKGAIKPDLVIDPGITGPGNGPKRIVNFIASLNDISENFIPPQGSENIDETLRNKLDQYIFDLSKTNFGIQLAKMGTHLMNRVSTYRFQLSRVPSISPQIKVKINGREISENEWKLETTPSYSVVLVHPENYTELYNSGNLQMEVEYNRD